MGDSDVGDIVMMVTDFRCWWQNHYVGDFVRYVGDFFNALNRSPTSQTCHHHIWSPTSVTNIDVTEQMTYLIVVWDFHLFHKAMFQILISIFKK